MCKALKDERCDKRAIQKSSAKIPQAGTLAMGEALKKLMKSTVFFNIDNNHSKSYNLLKDNKGLK